MMDSFGFFSVNLSSVSPAVDSSVNVSTGLKDAEPDISSRMDFLSRLRCEAVLCIRFSSEGCEGHILKKDQVGNLVARSIYLPKEIVLVFLLL